MRKLIIVTGLLCLSLTLSAETIAITNVNVIPMTTEKVMSRQTVIVKDGLIAEVGSKVNIPKGARRIDGSGRFLLPGLAEMHGHIPPPNAPAEVIDDTLFLYVANGITTVRGMLGHEGQLQLREKAKKNEIISPALYLAGPSFNGNSVTSPEQAAEKVRQQKAEAWDLLKVHPGLSKDEYDAMAGTARAEKIRFGGHVPAEVGLEHAIAQGQETFDHIDGYAEALNADAGPVDAAKLADLVRKTKDAGAWIVPTSALWEVLFGGIPLTELQAYPELKYVSQAAVDQWSAAFNQRLEQIPREAAKNILANRVTILRALHEGGVRILMGTDAPQQFSVPGFSLHRELLRMRAAGMTPYQILQSGTKNVGDYFAASDSFGTIERGRRADLILVDANPLEDIANVAKISGVMLRGKWLSRQDLDARLATIEARYERK